MLPDSGPERDRVVGRLWVLSAGLCMSLGGPIIRLADESMEWQFLFYRSLGAALALLIYFLFSGRPVLTAIRRTGATGIVGGLCLAVGFTGYVWGVMNSTVANALFLLSASPLFAALLGWTVMRESVSRSMWFAMGGVMAGVAIMIGEGLAEADVFGDLAALSAALGFAGFSVCIRRGRHTDMSPTILIAAAVTAAVSGAMAVAGGSGLAVPIADVGLATAYGVLVIGAGIFMLTIGARHVPAAELVVLSLTEVVLGSIWVALAFGELPSVLTFVGGVVVLGSIAAQAVVGMRRPD
ncbi:MAG: DMT family transporter [Defluviicoccus sp.]|nr:DMT family transporter [Defluviicoccus sp.]MDE0274731.1 DMT family transporter [Defluviicoccus sp.]